MIRGTLRTGSTKPDIGARGREELAVQVAKQRVGQIVPIPGRFGREQGCAFQIEYGLVVLLQVIGVEVAPRVVDSRIVRAELKRPGQDRLGLPLTLLVS